MTLLKSSVDPRSAGFRENEARMRALVGDLRDHVGRIKEGGGQSAREKHLARGKLLPRERNQVTASSSCDLDPIVRLTASSAQIAV